MAALLESCVTGHLVDAARRRERPVVVTAALRAGDTLVVRYAAVVENDAGAVVGHATGAAAIPRAVFRTPVPPPADRVAVRSLRATCAPDGVPMPVCRIGTDLPTTCRVRPMLEVHGAPGRDTAIVWHDDTHATPPVAVPTSALGRRWLAWWLWPLVPPALAVDAVLGPVLVALAPAVLVTGD